MRTTLVPMLEVALTPWQTYKPDWNVGFLWSRLDWILRLDVLVLAILLVYVIIVASRSAYHYRQAL
jgi:hypothetical protein